MEFKISPSILACDFANLESELKKCESADLIHLDVMDGHFVPNITIGAPVIKALKAVCSIPFDVHLMISNPLDYINDFADAGADIISFHTECESDINETINRIIECGCKPALAIKPATPAEAVYPYIDRLAMVLVMTVEPGFGGQSFMPDMMPKIKKIRNDFSDIDIQTDGGVNEKTIKECAKAGANVFVAGSAVFKSKDPAEAISVLRENAKGSV
ncbi:MAG: ribulose-phosphate 3-epimerase [Clostridiales bacterium]|nr:ribulose-phosphate 3-epimerase [Clostridiales bacterium]